MFKSLTELLSRACSSLPGGGAGVVLLAGLAGSFVLGLVMAVDHVDFRIKSSDWEVSLELVREK